MTEMTIRDEDGKNDLVVAFEWEDRGTMDVLDVMMGDKTARLNAKDFWSVAFAISSEQEQETLIPAKLMEVRKISKMVKVKAKEDIKAGEEITFKVGFDLTPMDINGEHPPTTGGYAEEVK